MGAEHETATPLRGAVATGSTTGDFLPARLWHYTTWPRTKSTCVLFGLLKRERGGGKRGEKGKVQGSGGVCRRHQPTANQASMHAPSDYCRSVPIQEL